MKTHLPAWVLATVTFAGVLALGWVDWFTGPDLNFFVFYFLPVSAAAWYLGLRTSVVVSLLSALVWFGANDLAGRPSSAHFYAVWNTGIRLSSFLYIGFAVSKMRFLLDKEQASAAALRQALSEIKVLQGVLPICAQCKKIRDQDNAWHQLEAYISDHSATRFSHGYCPDCAKKFMEEAGLAMRKTEPGG